MHDGHGNEMKGDAVGVRHDRESKFPFDEIDRWEKPA
jgi:hypothetical protein